MRSKTLWKTSEDAGECHIRADLDSLENKPPEVSPPFVNDIVMQE